MSKNGNQTRLWFDPWINGKSLVKLLGWCNLYQYGDTNATVGNIIQNHKWNVHQKPEASIFKAVIGRITTNRRLNRDK